MKTAVPSGFSSETNASDSDMPESWRLIRCPAVPAKVTRAFWPGVEIEIDVAGPPGVTVPTASAGTSYSVSVIEPVTVTSGSTTIVYTPVTGSVFVSMKPPEVPA